MITVSRYCAERLEEPYGVRDAIVVPELIDLNAWRQLFRANPATPTPGKFTIFSVCRFYPRKRLDVLLRAAGLLRNTIPGLEIRIIGNGPERARLQGICRELEIGPAVQWLGDVSPSSLAKEYNRCDLFCLPSVQEGFGIVFLEAMAAGKPIVAARAAAIPELVRSGVLVEPENPDALAEAIICLYRDPDLRRALASAGLRDVEQFEMSRVAARFLSAITKIAPGLGTEIPQAEERTSDECASGSAKTSPVHVARLVRRDLIRDGELKRLMEQDGLSGVTSNPTIFEKAIDGGGQLIE